MSGYFRRQVLDPNFRGQRPRVVGVDGMAYWMIDEQLFPRRVGRGCNNLGTPVTINGEPAKHSLGKADSVGSQELTNIPERLAIMDEEEIAVQVVYTTLFLAYPLTSNIPLATALCDSYNRWLGDRLGGNDRIKWSAVVNLDDVDAAVRSVNEAAKLGAVSVMVLGTAGDRLLDDDAMLPFYEAVEGNNLALGVHVGWSCPSVNNLYSHIYPSGVIAFHMPVLMACTSLIAGGILDRFPDMRVVFLEAGCMWVPFILDRLKHRYENQGELLLKLIPETVPAQALPAMDYVEKGNLFFSAEIEDSLLPHVMGQVGEGQIVMGRTCLTATGSVSPRACCGSGPTSPSPPRTPFWTPIPGGSTRCRTRGPSTSLRYAQDERGPLPQPFVLSVAKRSRRTPFLTMADDHRFPLISRRSAWH